ncbi:hypothetical protein COW81_02475 [Candidatus Campbellbacteria bacterium CG22_combo_CG10-13_8_21_14_all_36_13]|uniref:POTRA domain-containing protein n=1 Tax=Candidatus Campbellbacteria bacterium CG22_combo_CG10-13_8_21_14_all_36_13 TaxID=1974529 RepID=A0A2H0DXX2_9BACT|nr:MAG: hypothetical protein COW81_02475 [Candidatus Campbellbacteria bacterium CG22_combo_CG10-13_8_21_14_all_36_13]
MLFGRHRIVSKKHRDKQKSLRVIILAVILVLLLFIILFFSWVGYGQKFKIKNIEVSGLSTLSKSSVLETVENTLNRKLFFIFPRDNTVLISKRGIVSDIKNTFKQSSRVDVSLKDLNSIEIDIEERKPIGVWCTSRRLITEVFVEKCYFIDSTGYVFSDAPKFSGNLFFKYYGGNTNESPVGSRYLPEKVFRERAFFIASIPNLGINPISYKWGENGDSTIVVAPQNEKGLDGKIIFNNDDELGAVYDYISSALLHEDFKYLDQRIIKFEYIDLRSGNKIFYKMD